MYFCDRITISFLYREFAVYALSNGLIFCSLSLSRRTHCTLVRCEQKKMFAHRQTNMNVDVFTLKTLHYRWMFCAWFFFWSTSSFIISKSWHLYYGKTLTATAQEMTACVKCMCANFWGINVRNYNLLSFFCSFICCDYQISRDGYAMEHFSLVPLAAHYFCCFVLGGIFGPISCCVSWHAGKNTRTPLTHINGRVFRTCFPVAAAIDRLIKLRYGRLALVMTRFL